MLFLLAQMIDNSSVFTPSPLYVDIDILKQHPTSEDIKLYCIQYMRDETRSFAYTRAVLKELDHGARKEITRLGGNIGLMAILDRLRIDQGEEVVV
jgi:geranylgeranyl diphosphate synthase type 3